jgi:FkbM family methyltransferase
LVRRFGAEVWILDPTPRAINHFAALRDYTLRGESYPINRDVTVTYRICEQDLVRLHYLPIGLWSSDDVLKFFSPANSEHVSHSIVNIQRTRSFVELEVRRLKSVMTDLGHTRIDLLKLDIEGAEFAVLESILEDKLDIGVICCEYDEWHHPLDSSAVKRINSSIRRMKKAGYILADVDQDCNVMFIRKDIFKRITS